jgi:hypothetical protein
MKIRTIVLKYICIGLLPLLTITSCSSSKRLTASATIAAPAKEASKSVTQTKLHLPQFSTMNAAKCKFVITLREKSYSITSSVKIIKDSVIQLSIMPLLGIEMYRAVLRPDSITIIDKNNHNYFVTDYGFFQKRFGVSISFKDVQSLLSNQPLNPTDEVGNSELKVNDNGYEWITSYKDLKADYQFSKEYQLNKTTLEQPGSESTFNCNYSNFNTFDSVVFPTQCSIEASHNRQQTGFTFTIEKLTFNTQLNINSINFSDYNRVGLDQILPF